MINQNLKNQSRLLPFYLKALFAIFFSLNWLLVNHLKPWPAFYSDALASVVLWGVSILVISRARTPLGCSTAAIGAFLIALIPFVQYFVGIIYHFGTAWINFIYLLGFSISIAVGYIWECDAPGECVDFIFSAILIAAVISVGIQLEQWFAGGNVYGWLMASPRGRYFANVGQPNQLATLLLLAVCGVILLYSKNYIGAACGVFAIVYLLIGVVLTESRTAYLNLFVMWAAMFFYSIAEKRREILIWLFLVAIIFLVLVLGLPLANAFLFDTETEIRTAGDPVRLAMLGVLAEAIPSAPFFGYGWGQLGAAWLGNANYPNIGSSFMHSHNIIMDLLLYNGLAVGSGLVVLSGYVLLRISRGLNDIEKAIPLLAVAILLIHAMLEWPLHYAYFLLPFGLLLGGLIFNSGFKPIGFFGKITALFVLFAVGVFVVVTIMDVLEVQRTYFSINYAKRGQVVPADERADLFFLNQFTERQQLANMPNEIIEDVRTRPLIRRVFVALPRPEIALNMAQNYAKNNDNDIAVDWLKLMCKIAPPTLSVVLEKEWEVMTVRESSFGNVNWKRCETAIDN